MTRDDKPWATFTRNPPSTNKGYSTKRVNFCPPVSPQDLLDASAQLPVNIPADSWGLPFPEAMLQGRGWGTGARKVKRKHPQPLLPQAPGIINSSRRKNGGVSTGEKRPWIFGNTCLWLRDLSVEFRALSPDSFEGTLETAGVDPDEGYRSHKASISSFTLRSLEKNGFV